MRRSLLFLAVLASVSLLGLTVAGTAGAGISNKVVVKKSTRFNSVNPKDVRAFCPDDYHRTGGGANVDGRGSNRNIAIHDNRPIQPQGWRAAAHEIPPDYDRRWSLTVRVVCVQD